MEKFVSPIQVILGLNGLPLSSGVLHIGVANLNPVTNHISVYWDSAATKPAVNPVRIKNGMIYNGASPATLFVGGDCSFAVIDSNNRTVMSVPTMDAGLSIPISRVSVDQDLDVNGHKITEVANGTLESDAVNLGQVRRESYRMATSITASVHSFIGSYSPPITSLNDGLLLAFNNTGLTYSSGTGYTFTPNSGVIPPKAIKMSNLYAIPSNCIYEGINKLRYNANEDCWILEDSPFIPYRSVFSSLVAEANSSSHTLAIQAVYDAYSSIPFFKFNSSGIPQAGYDEVNSIQISLGLTVPFGATLGTFAGRSYTLAVLLLIDPETKEFGLGIVNAIGLNADESKLVSSVDISAAALDVNTIYSSGARTNNAFRVLGYVSSTMVGSGRWDNAVTDITACFANDPETNKSTSATPWTTPIPAAGVQLKATHNLKNTPFKVTLEFRCLTPEHGYSDGDIVECVQFGSYMTINLWKSPTEVGAGLPAGNDFKILNKTTGALATPTKEVWAYRFLLTR